MRPERSNCTVAGMPDTAQGPLPKVPSVIKALAAVMVDAFMGSLKTTVILVLIGTSEALFVGLTKVTTGVEGVVCTVNPLMTVKLSTAASGGAGVVTTTLR